MPVGSYVDRNFKANQFEYYLQDSFRVTPKLTVTFGIRHSIAQTPYETNGQQVSPNISMNEWFKTRVAERPRGSSISPTSLHPSGKANGGKPM